MKKLLLALGLLAFASTAQAQQTMGPMALACNKIFVGTAAGTVASAPSAPQGIHVCGVDVNTNTAAGAFELSYGTGTVCATNTKDIYNWTALPVGNVVDHTAFVWFDIPTAQNFCIVTATTVSFTIYYGVY